MADALPDVANLTKTVQDLTNLVTELVKLSDTLVGYAVLFIIII